ncbi:carbon storage regulator CsrA [Patescibacteria group bacterium]|nr:carbon storage regulator CsrA [Patescibacteria group bacterium]MBU1124253.1 carbon storage regulator CsrA [Patescibacteria group bacterium]
MAKPFVPKSGTGTLVLSRKKDERIVIGDSISIMVVDIRGDKVRLGIDALRDITVHRKEVYDAIQRENPPTPPAAEGEEPPQ